MAHFLLLEDFEEQNRHENAMHGDPVESLPGYDAGYAAGMAAAQAAQSSVDAALVQTLSEMSFGFAEARQHILQGLRPLFSALIDQLLPRVADETFRARLIDTLQQIAQNQMDTPVHLHVHSSQTAPMAALLPNVNGLDVSLISQDEIGPHGALISQGDAEFAVDLDDLIAQVTSILAAIFDITDHSEETTHHG